MLSAGRRLTSHSSQARHRMNVPTTQREDPEMTAEWTGHWGKKLASRHGAEGRLSHRPRGHNASLDGSVERKILQFGSNTCPRPPVLRWVRAAPACACAAAAITPTHSHVVLVVTTARG